MKYFLLIFIVCVSLNYCFSQEKKIDLSNLEEVKETIEGQWYKIVKKDTIFKNFKFNKNNYSCVVLYADRYGTISHFELLRENNKTIMRWHNILGSDKDNIIVKLTTSKMIIKVSRFKKITWTKKI